MDQDTIEGVIAPNPADPCEGWEPGDAWLAGGTFLLSLALPQLRRFRDLSAMTWDPFEVSDSGLRLSPMCTIRELLEFEPPPEWAAGPLLGDCVRAFLAGFKIWNSATVGGNICTSIPAGPMTSMACALDAQLSLIAPRAGSRTVRAVDFVTGNNINVLEPGELLTDIVIPVDALRRRYAWRRFSLTKAGRSSVFLIATGDAAGSDFRLTVTAATERPVRLDFDRVPDSGELDDALRQIPDQVYFHDPNGRPDHRKHLTWLYAEQLRAQLSQPQEG